MINTALEIQLVLVKRQVMLLVMLLLLVSCLFFNRQTGKIGLLLKKAPNSVLQYNLLFLLEKIIFYNNFSPLILCFPGSLLPDTAP